MNRVLTFPQLKSEKGIPWSRQHIGRLARAGRFPKGRKLGPNTKVWDEPEIDTYLADPEDWIRRRADDVRKSDGAPAAVLDCSAY